MQSVVQLCYTTCVFVQSSSALSRFNLQREKFIDYRFDFWYCRCAQRNWHCRRRYFTSKISTDGLVLLRKRRWWSLCTIAIEPSSVCWAALRPTALAGVARRPPIAAFSQPASSACPLRAVRRKKRQKRTFSSSLATSVWSHPQPRQALELARKRPLLPRT